MKKLSVITINFNNREGLRKTINSVVNQSFSDFEYIIIDGGSTDGSVDVIKEYADKIDYWISEPDTGIYNAMNKGILKATGEYCNFMNSGDCFCHDSVLETISSYFHEDIINGKHWAGNQNHLLGHFSSSITMLDFVRSSISHQASFIRRALFENNLYDESLKIVSDWKFFIDVIIFKNCSFKNLDIVVAHFDDSGISNTNLDMNTLEREKVLRQFLPERIYIDYLRLSKADSPLLELTPYLNRTYGFQNFVYKLVSCLIRIYSFMRRLFPIENQTSP
jgi:Glycosyltransferases involved in cell wall biogenesis